MKFYDGPWKHDVNVRDFIQRHYTPYDGDATFLCGPTENTKKLWQQLLDKMEVERERNGVYDIDEKTISTIPSNVPSCRSVAFGSCEQN